MPNTYVALRTETVAASTASVTLDLTGISGYTDLVLVANVKLTSSLAYMMGTYNGDVGTNYSQTSLSGNGASAASSRNNATTVNYLTQYQNINTASFTTFILQFMNYSNTTTYKTVITRSGNGTNASTNDTTEAVVGTWRSNAAINSLKFTFSASTIVAGSTMTLYGILAA